MTPEQTRTADRLRALLEEDPGEPFVYEKPMFGVRAFMVHEKLAVCARKDGGLLVHVDPSRSGELIERGAAQAEMGAGRSMGPAWVTVSAKTVETEAGLRFWLDVALEYNRTLAGG